MGVSGRWFVFNGITSEYKGVRLVSFEAESSDYSNIGYTVSRSSLNSHRQKVYAHSRTYEEVLTFRLTVAKNDFTAFSQSEKRDIIKWLSGNNTQKPLYIVDYPFETTHIGVTYNCICTRVEENRPHPRELYGLTFHYECNAPFGYSDEKEVSFTSTHDTYTTITLNVDNDDPDNPIYPMITLTPSNTQTFSFRNASIEDADPFLVKGYANDTITIDSELGIIKDAVDTFHYDSETNLLWLTLVDGVNHIVISGDCTGTIKWTEPRKVGI